MWLNARNGLPSGTAVRLPVRKEKAFPSKNIAWDVYTESREEGVNNVSVTSRLKEARIRSGA